MIYPTIQPVVKLSVARIYFETHQSQINSLRCRNGYVTESKNYSHQKNYSVGIKKILGSKKIFTKTQHRGAADLMFLQHFGAGTLQFAWCLQTQAEDLASTRSLQRCETGALQFAWCLQPFGAGTLQITRCLHRFGARWAHVSPYTIARLCASEGVIV